MLKNRQELRDKLRIILGNSNTYFQPPKNITIKYPCAIYSLDGVNAVKANDKIYANWNRFSVTFITSDPDNSYYDAMNEQFDFVRFDRRFVSDGMYHDVYTVY